MMEELGRYGVVGQKPPAIDLPDGVTARYVPLISWAQAGTMASFSDEAYQYEAHLAFNVTDRRAIAVQIRGDSMRPPYDEGDIVILYPSSEPRNGDLVIARLSESAGGDVMFKIYSVAREQITLSSYNPAYPPMTFPREDFAWIYPAASVVKNLRK
jgi:SOS-response transcriptional repressor LexA